MEHTKGPWMWQNGALVVDTMFRDKEHILWPANTIDPDDAVGALCPDNHVAWWRYQLGACGGDAEANAPANAMLIAAAPDLLEALRTLEEDISDRFDIESSSCNPGMRSAVYQARKAIAKAMPQKQQ
jgi:hypothetical protein